ncbi:MAG: molybdenum ABC transporter ATP-binding protein [Pseudohongiellaceae bacterium]|nr:molybdenum ABC transporter ATP-binding protein [Pseudohongiellaceae bacterium]
MSIRAHLQCTKGAFTLDAQFEVPLEGVTAVFGPSGCGKSTLLRCIAGLEQASPISELQIGKQTWFKQGQGVAVHERGVGYVSQAPSLFLHLSVQGNLDFALKRRPDQAVQISQQDAVELTGIAPLLERSPETLSGGEKQRVAIARALLGGPKLLLMDEPLAALDVDSKEAILPYLERLSRSVGIPIVYVSHSCDEVARLADYLLLMEGGKIRAQGPLGEVLAKTDSPLARSADAFSVLRCAFQALDPVANLAEFVIEGSEVKLYIPAIDAEGKRFVRVRVSARDVSVCLEQPVGSSILNILPVRLKQIGHPDMKGQVLLSLLPQGSSDVLLARVSAFSCEKLGLQEGMSLYAQVKSVALL